MTPPPVRTAFTTGSTGGTADCDGHPVALGLKPLITLATTMGHARDDDFKRKIQQNVLRGFMAQTPLDAVHPIVFTDQPERPRPYVQLSLPLRTPLTRATSSG